MVPALTTTATGGTDEGVNAPGLELFVFALFGLYAL